MPKKIIGKGFENYHVTPVQEGHPLFPNVGSFPDMVKGPKSEWAMTKTGDPNIFYPTAVHSAAPSAIRGVHRFRKEGDNYFPVF